MEPLSSSTSIHDASSEMRELRRIHEALNGERKVLLKRYRTLALEKYCSGAGVFTAEDVLRLRDCWKACQDDPTHADDTLHAYQQAVWKLIADEKQTEEALRNILTELKEENNSIRVAVENIVTNLT